MIRNDGLYNKALLEYVVGHDDNGPVQNIIFRREAVVSVRTHSQNPEWTTVILSGGAQVSLDEDYEVVKKEVYFDD